MITKDMSNNLPERMSFSEIKSMLPGKGSYDRQMRVIGHDLVLLRSGEILFPAMLHPGTPYILEDCRLGFLRGGEARVTINLIEHELKPGTVAFLGAGNIIQVDWVSPDFDLCGMMISDERMKGALKGSMPTWCAGNAAYFMLQPTSAEVEVVERLIDTAWLMTGMERFSGESLNGVIHAIVHYYNYLKERSTDNVVREVSRNREIFERFIALVNAFGKHERSLAFYADKMCITPRYLGTAVRTASGITAKEWIDRAVVTNAKILLKYGNGQVVQIADDLHFANASFFCKFFRRMTGMTPQEYRRKG